MFPETGCSNLNLRELSRKTGVNLGMFPYYFKTKEKFTKAVLQDFYEEFFLNFDLESISSESSPIERLRSVLYKVAIFVRDNQGFMSALMTDLMNGEKIALEFIEDNIFRHLKIMMKLIEDCKKSRQLTALSSMETMAFVMPTIVGPIMLDSKLKTFKKRKLTKPANFKMSVVSGSNHALLKRIDLTLFALNNYKSSKTAVPNAT